ncbi:POZ [Glarea lozoyensis ATCC 20868]|uniref:POZ n=1 Tax=Glarea lozoyensis (strain ATCC 20868 / MF5171) TaxID=1116229 RepID=S3E441_GLAL2|nr:POZ [Glarea lozoyensis ATCC 20868]EPE33203.1 POZ [Glarea lozoyensis ATCC 20868]
MPNKRKRDNEGPEIEQPTTVNKDDEVKQNTLHSRISAKVIMFSPTILVVVGKSKEGFTLHKDLLSLHSSWFEEYFSAMDNAQNLILTTVEAAPFETFVYWLYSGEKPIKLGLYDKGSSSVTESLICANILRSPAYSNIIMNALIESMPRAAMTGTVRFILWLSHVYNKTGSTSVLSKFMYNYVSHNNPFTQCTPGSEPFVLWEGFLKAYPQFAFDLAVAAGKKWKGATGPCDIEVRSEFMEEEFDLNKRWEELILQKQTKAEIEVAAKANRLRSVVQLRHLNRDKAKD